MSLEVKFLEVWVYVESFGPEVICARDVRDDAFSVLPYHGQPHPHVPIPLLKGQGYTIVKHSISYCVR